MSAREGKEQGDQKERSNLVMAFPEWRNWESGELTLDFDDIEEEMDFALDKNGQAFGSFEAYRNRRKTLVDSKALGKTTEDQLIDSIENKTREIKSAQARIKFYLEEIEMFLPRRK